MQHVSVVVYFTFVIALCVFVVIATIIVLQLCLRAESQPLVAMPLWVSHFFHILMSVNSGVTRVGDTRGGNWRCHPSIFPEKPGDFFLLIAVTIKRVAHCFHSGVTPSRDRVCCHLFYLSDLVSPLFFVILPGQFIYENHRIKVRVAGAKIVCATQRIVFVGSLPSTETYSCL